jgi:hypothetical protein
MPEIVKTYNLKPPTTGTSAAATTSTLMRPVLIPGSVAPVMEPDTSKDENPKHRQDFTRLVSAAAKKRK